MFTSEQKQTLVHAINHFGVEHQTKQALQEMGELIVELERRDTERFDRDHVVEEIADVIVTIGQLRIIYGAERVDKIIDQKLDRLEWKMDGDWRRAARLHPLIYRKAKNIDNHDQN